MLKIKDNVDLKELEKYGFKEEPWGYKYYPKGNSPKTRYFSSINIDGESRKEWDSYKRLCFSLENMWCWCNSLEELESDFENIKYSYNDYKRLIDDLIKADLVEKVGDDE